jgi:phenol hydroxylase P5 protein
VTIEAEIDEEPDAESIPVKDFPGTVTRIETLTPTIKGIFISSTRRSTFRPASTSTWTFPVSASAAPSRSPMRQGGREVELNIRIVPGGVGTTYLHEQLSVGDRMRSPAPMAASSCASRPRCR